MKKGWLPKGRPQKRENPLIKERIAAGPTLFSDFGKVDDRILCFRQHESCRSRNSLQNGGLKRPITSYIAPVMIKIRKSVVVMARIRSCGGTSI